MSDTIAELCKKFRPNHILYGPAYWEALADDNDDIDLSHLIAPISGGDKISVATEAKINKYFQTHGCQYPLMNGYGMTEVGAAVSVCYQRAHELGSVGIPFVKNIISTFDVDTGEELTYGKEGEICIYAPSTMNGYVNNPEETANLLRQHKDGKLWVHSGDLGYISKDGFVHISGRLKRYMLCIADGIQKKVFSLDIERVLLEHPKIEKCAVVPVDHDEQCQAPVAFVILKNGLTSDLSIEAELKAYSKANLDKIYRPLRYIIIEKFPLTKVGKVDYLKLEKDAAEKIKEHNYML